QANKLKVVEGRGELSLSVRNVGDNTLADASPGLTLEEVLGLPKKPVPVPPVVVQPFQTEIYRGRSRQINTFDRSVLQESFTAPDPGVPPAIQGPPPTDPAATPANVNELK